MVSLWWITLVIQYFLIQFEKPNFLVIRRYKRWVLCIYSIEPLDAAYTCRYNVGLHIVSFLLKAWELHHVLYAGILNVLVFRLFFITEEFSAFCIILEEYDLSWIITSW